MGESYANVILRIGSKFGPGGLSSLKAGWDMVKGFTNSIVEHTKELDRMKVAMDRVDMTMVNYADDAAKGQVSTESLVRQLNMLNQSAPKLKITQEQYGIMAARAAEFAEATDAPGGATAVFERMTNGIARAESEALKPFGIKLKENIDMTKTQKQAVDALTKGYEDLEYTLKSNGQRMNQLSNNWGTFVQALYNATGELPLVGSAIDSINDVLGETVKALTESTKATRDWVFQWENFQEIVIPTLQMMGGLLTGNITPAIASYAARFQNLIKKGISDKNLQKAIADELAAKEEKKYGVPVAPISSGGGGPTPVDLSGGIGLGFGAEYWAKALQTEITPENADWLESFARRMGSMGLQSFRFQTSAKELGFLKGMGGQIEMPSFDRGMAFSSAGTSVDQRMAEADAEQKIVEAHERRLQLVTDEFEIMRQIKEINDEELIQMQESAVQRRARLELVTSEEYHEARLKELREDEQVYQAERQIELEFAREQALDFAQQFGDVWSAAMDRISAGGMAADGVLNIMRSTWGAIVTAAIEGHNGIGEAIRETIKAVGIQIAIEAGLMALLSAGRAIYYAATRQYASATKAGLAAASFAATAVVAGVAAATASAFGKSAKSIRQVSIPSSSSASSPASSYGGAYSGEQPMRQEVIIRLAPDAGSQMFEVVQQQNTMARRSGTTSFTEDAA
jgi:hypothetical protein